MSYFCIPRKFRVFDEEAAGDFDNWSTEVEAVDPQDAANTAAAKAWSDWAHENGDRGFFLFVETAGGRREKFDISVDFEPVFFASAVPR